jgi:hypothetical protein
MLAIVNNILLFSWNLLSGYTLKLTSYSVYVNTWKDNYVEVVELSISIIVHSLHNVHVGKINKYEWSLYWRDHPQSGKKYLLAIHQTKDL